MIDILKQFKGVVDIPTEKEKLDSLDEQFRLMAKELLYGGYFLIEGKKRLYLDDIEFYYHEETADGLKDPIMYHTNENEGKGKDIPYFELGRLNLHVSGVDVTFENPDKHYRASFLIRGFHIGCSAYDPHAYDSHSTHVYSEMLYMGVPLGKTIEIKWVNEKQPEKETYIPKGEWRQNVAEYEYKEGKYSKIECKEKDFDPDKYFRYSGHVFKKCARKWRFKKYDI